MNTPTLFEIHSKNERPESLQQHYSIGACICCRLSYDFYRIVLPGSPLPPLTRKRQPENAHGLIDPASHTQYQLGVEVSKMLSYLYLAGENAFNALEAEVKKHQNICGATIDFDIGRFIAGTPETYRWILDVVAAQKPIRSILTGLLVCCLAGPSDGSVSTDGLVNSHWRTKLRVICSPLEC